MAAKTSRASTTPRRRPRRLQVKDVMTANPRVCSPRTTLAEAGAMLLDADCGILPVVDDDRLVGVITDRDICIALTTRDQRASALVAGDVVQAPLWTCGPDDDLRTALETMQQGRVRRLPVTGLGGALIGIVSINDIVLKHDADADPHILSALHAICAHPTPAPQVMTG